MGKVAITFRIMPESAEDDVEAIGEKISELGAKQIDIEEVAFGLKALKVLFVVDDKEGGQDLEEKLGKIEGIGSVESEGITLL